MESPTKQLTVDVPEDRVAEFYAFYARFLAGRRRRRHRHGERHGGCGRHRRHEGRERPEDTVTEA